MGYNSPKEAKKMVGGIMKRRTLIIIGLILAGIIFFPTIRNMATSYEAMVVEKVDGSLDYSTRKSSLNHADYKSIVLCDTNGKEFEKYVENSFFDGLKEGTFIKKQYFNNGFDVVDSVAGADHLKMYCKIHPPKPKPEIQKKAEAAAPAPTPPTGPPPAEKPIVPPAPGEPAKQDTAVKQPPVVRP
jgi:hypothetical protein